MAAALTYGEWYEGFLARHDPANAPDLDAAEFSAIASSALGEYIRGFEAALETTEGACAELSWMLAQHKPGAVAQTSLPANCWRILSVSGTWNTVELPLTRMPYDKAAASRRDPFSAPCDFEPAYCEVPGTGTPRGRKVQVLSETTPAALTLTYYAWPEPVDADLRASALPPYPRAVQEQVTEIILRKTALKDMDALRYQGQAQETKI